MCIKFIFSFLYFIYSDSGKDLLTGSDITPCLEFSRSASVEPAWALVVRFLLSIKGPQYLQVI